MRQRCLELSEKGMSAEDIARTLTRSVRWVRKWRRRATSRTHQWYRNQSRAPKHPARKVDDHWEQQVVQVRRELVQRREAGGHAFVGSIGIRAEMENRQMEVNGHSLRLIERIVQRQRLAEPRKKRSRSGPKRYYPGPHNRAKRPWDLHEIDFVTPLFLRGGSRLSVLSRVDTVSGHAVSWVNHSKTSEVVMQCLLKDWQQYGVPAYLQMDNDAAFEGGMHHPRSIGRLIRLCLYLGVQPVFIPPRSPFYNGHVESYQGHWQEQVWERFEFADDVAFQEELDRFRDELAAYRSYERRLRGRPDADQRDAWRLAEDWCLPREIPLCWGKLHFVRKVADSGGIEILNETFSVSKDLAHDYVWAVIDTHRESLTVTYYGDGTITPQSVLTKPYAFREAARRRPSTATYRPLPRPPAATDH